MFYSCLRWEANYSAKYIGTIYIVRNLEQASRVCWFNINSYLQQDPHDEDIESRLTLRLLNSSSLKSEKSDKSLSENYYCQWKTFYTFIEMCACSLPFFRTSRIKSMKVHPMNSSKCLELIAFSLNCIVSFENSVFWTKSSGNRPNASWIPSQTFSIKISFNSRWSLDSKSDISW